MSCNCGSSGRQGTQYCQECLPSIFEWLVPVKGVPDPFLMDRNHAYVTDEGDVYVLDYDRTAPLQLSGLGLKGIDTLIEQSTKEVTQARGGHPSLDARLDVIEETDNYLQGQINTNKTDISDMYLLIDNFVATVWNGKQLLDIFYPIGVIYESVKPDNPSTFMGGTWARFGNGQVLVGVNESDTDFNTVNKTGGEKTHVLTVNEMPSHTHDITVEQKVRGGGTGYTLLDAGTATKLTSSSAGGGQAHNNLQPFVTVYRWQRTA